MGFYVLHILIIHVVSSSVTWLFLSQPWSNERKQMKHAGVPVLYNVTDCSCLEFCLQWSSSCHIFAEEGKARKGSLPSRWRSANLSKWGAINFVSLACPMAKFSPAWMSFTCVESSACSVMSQNLQDEHYRHLLGVLGETELSVKNDRRMSW